MEVPVVQEHANESPLKLSSAVSCDEKMEFDDVKLSPGVGPPTTHKESPTMPTGTIPSGIGEGSAHLVKTELENTQKDVPTDAMFMLSNSSMSVEFRTDQVREDNFTDLDIICCDGYVQVHRCLLLAASKFLQDLLIDKDIMDTTAISLPDVSVHHMTQVLSLLYCGKTLIDKTDEVKIFSIMTLIGLPVDSLLCRTAKENDANEISFLRHVSNNIWVTSTQYGTGKTILEDEMDNKILVDNISENFGSQTNDSESNNLTNTDGNSSAGEDTFGEDSLKCATCGLKHNSEEELLKHMQTSENCSDEVSQWICFEKKMCLVCEYIAPKRAPIRDLVDHVSFCMESSKRRETEKEMSESVSRNEENDLTSLTDAQDLEDISFEEACNGLEKQMSLQSQQLKTKKMLRKGVKVCTQNNFDDVDVKSISSTESCTTSSIKSGKRRKLSGGSNTDNCSIGSNDQLVEPSDQPSVNTYSNVNQDCIRLELNILKPRDIYDLTAANLRMLFQQCPLCKIKYLKSKRAARCLRNHGYRICWVCLKILPVHGSDFEDHNQAEHLQSPESKVTCPLCLKKFDCNIGLPTHMGNFHYPRVREQAPRDTLGDISCPSASLSPIHCEKQETTNCAKDTISANSGVFELSNGVSSEETKLETISESKTSPPAEPLQIISGISEAAVVIDSASSSHCSPSHQPVESALIPAIPPDIAKSMEELARMVRSCQICHKMHKFSENATKCIKSHGYKRCWGCIKAFPTDGISKHVSETHDVPGKPGIVKCFICSKDYAYDKGLNLHIGKHLAFYIRVRDMLPSKTKNISDETNSKDGSKSESEVETKSVKSEETKKEETTPKRKRGNRKSNCETLQKKSKTVQNGKRSTIQAAKDEGNITDQEKIIQSEPDGLAQVALPLPLGRNNPLAGRVFLETKDINGVKYNVYGFMDPVEGVQSGKTIAIQSNKDPSVKA